MTTYIDISLIIKGFAGLGLLLFGLYTFEESLKILGGRHLKRILEAQTHTLLRGLRSGTWISAVTTSSTFVSLLLVAFVGAGMLSLHNAIGVVLGANIGTTLNSLAVAYLGFGEFKISKIALPMIALGGIIHMISKKEKYLHIANMCIGIGLLFVGLDYMKSSVDGLAKSINLGHITNLWMFGVIGYIITALMHSQAAMSVITLAALNAALIDTPAAFAIIIGANIGTTMTALTASLSGSSAHRQIALSHVLQNVIAAIFGIIFFWQFHWLCTTGLGYIFGFAGNKILATARFNTSFNVLTAIPFMFFPSQFANFIKRLAPSKQEHYFLIEKFRSIGAVSSTIGIQLRAASNDCKTLFQSLQRYIYAITNHRCENYKLIPQQYDDEQLYTIYHTLKEDITTVYSNLLPLQQSSLQKDDVVLLTNIEHSITTIAECSKAFKNIAKNIRELANDTDTRIQELYHTIILQIHHHVHDETPSPSEQEIQEPCVKVLHQIQLLTSDIDVAALIALQYGLSSAHEHYEHALQRLQALKLG